MNDRTCCKLRPIKFNRWGLAENPVGWFIKSGDKLLEVTGTYRRTGYASCVMLKTKHFDGSEGPDVAAGAALVIPGHFHEDGIL